MNPINHTDHRSFDICIVGGGASGTILLIHLMRCIQENCSIVVINKGYPQAKGVAYSTESFAHLLNVRAGKMSAIADDPSHFTRWLTAHCDTAPYTRIDSLTDAFVPRLFYGQYLEETLQESLTNKPSTLHVEWIHDFAVDVSTTTPYQVFTSESGSFTAKKICLCTGVEPTKKLPVPGSIPADPRIHVNGWTKQIPLLKDTHDILIVGTGLTMVDQVLSILETGFIGKIIALSRHGQLPMPHPEKKYDHRLSEEKLNPPRDLNELFSLIKQRIKKHPDPMIWQEPILEDLRPHSQKLWYSFSTTEKQRFLRHLQHHWSKLRHRIPYAAYHRIKSAHASGQLDLIAGKLHHVSITDAYIGVEIIQRNGQKRALRTERIFNCTGPVLDICQSSNDIIRNMALKGLIRSSASMLGPDASMEGFAINQQGFESSDICVLGPPMRGAIWEAVAIPEIRTAALAIAKTLQKQLSS